MAFKEDFQKLVGQILQRKNYVTNEETTKQSLILPFIKTLGYDVYDPLEVRPEYSAGFAKNKEKIDYAIFKDEKIVMFVEAKPIGDSLTTHDPQLSKYFNSTPEAKIAIITNGIHYKFFTDLNQPNIMDPTPFYEFDFENVNDNDIETLQRFRKDVFDLDNVVLFAEDLVYLSSLKKALKELLRNPSDDFIRFLIKDIANTKLTANVVNRYRPVVKKAITASLLEIVSQGIMQNEEAEKPVEATCPPATPDEDKPLANEEEKPKTKVVTTEDELMAFEVIKSILDKNNLDTTEVLYKDTTNYFAICIRNTTHWIVRINISPSYFGLITPLDIEQAKELSPGFNVEIAPKGTGVSRVILNDISDLEKLSALICACYDCAKY